MDGHSECDGLPVPGVEGKSKSSDKYHCGVVSFIALVATFFVGELSVRYIFQAAIEGVLMVWIVWNAWKWPKQDA